MSKMTFLPIPVDAMFNRDLTLNDLRVLAAITSHDRKGANGRGCFASVGTLARIAGCDIRTAERAIKKLRELGYLRVEKGRKDGRQRVYRVVYADDTSAKTDTHDGNLSPDNRQRHPKSPTEADAAIQSDQRLSGVKQNHKQIVQSVEADPAEAASLLRRDASVQKPSRQRSFEEELGTYLRRIESRMAAMSQDERRHYVEQLDGVIEKLDHGTSLYHWAERLAGELDWLNDSAAYDEANA